MREIPSMWTPIAEESRGVWRRLEGAPVTVNEAREMHDAGLILMAQRRPDPVDGRLSPLQLVIKAKT